MRYGPSFFSSQSEQRFRFVFLVLYVVSCYILPQFIEWIVQQCGPVTPQSVSSYINNHSHPIAVIWIFPRATMMKSMRKSDWLVDTTWYITWYQLTNQICAFNLPWWPEGLFESAPDDVFQNLDKSRGASTVNVTWYLYFQGQCHSIQTPWPPLEQRQHNSVTPLVKEGKITQN